MRIDPAARSARGRRRLLISAVVPRPVAFVTSRGRPGVTDLAPFLPGVDASRGRCPRAEERR